MTKIISDLDDVLADTIPAYLGWANRQIGRQIMLEDILKLSSEDFQSRYGIEKQWLYGEGQKEFFRKESELERIKARETLSRKETPRVVISGREESVREISKYWLRKHYNFNGELELTSRNRAKKIIYVGKQRPCIYLDDDASILRGINSLYPRVETKWIKSHPFSERSGYRGAEYKTVMEALD